MSPEVSQAKRKERKERKEKKTKRTNAGAGYDQIDIPACTARSILVSNTPSAVDDATADINIFLLLGALRNLPGSMAALREGKWRGSPPPALGHDPQGKVLGILGMGGIGRNVSRKAAVFGMRVRYHNRTRLPEEVERECGAEYVDFDTLLAESDVLSLNLPLNVSFFLPFPMILPASESSKDGGVHICFSQRSGK